MTVKVLFENSELITIIYNEKLRFQFELLDENVRFKRADSVIKQDSEYRAGGNSERTSRYKMPHFEGNEKNIPMEVLNELQNRGHLEKDYF